MRTVAHPPESPRCFRVDRQEKRGKALAYAETRTKSLETEITLPEKQNALERDSSVETAPGDPPHSRPFYKHIYFWVLIGVALGVGVGLAFPSHNGQPGVAEQMKPLADGFIDLIKMLIAPIIFFTVVGGIARVGDLGKVGRVGLKALVYFEVVTTIAMLLALGTAHLFKPGVGVDYKPSASEVKKLTTYNEAAGHQSTVEFILHVIP